MMRAIVLLALLWPALGLAAEPSDMSGKDLFDWCQKGQSLEFACVSYLTGVADTVKSVKALDARIAADEPVRKTRKKARRKDTRPVPPTSPTLSFLCIPPATTAQDLQSTYLQYAENNRPFLDRPANRVVLRAFTDAWPCPAKP